MEKLKNLLAAGEFDNLADELKELSDDSLNSFFHALSDEDLRQIGRSLDSEALAEALVRLPATEQERLISLMKDSDLKDVMEEVSVDDTVDIIEDMPTEAAKRIAEEDEILQLIEEHSFAVLKPLLCEFNPIDIAEILNEVPKSEVGIIFRLLPKELAAETFVEMDSERQQALITLMSDIELKAVMDELFIDDTVDIIEEMPANVVKRILRQTGKEERTYINELLKYPRDSAGSIMTIEFVSVTTEMTVADAFERIRKTGVDKETIYTLYVTDDKKKLVGIVTAKELLLASPDAKIGDIMEDNVIYVDTLTDKEVVSNTIAKYGFLALPVVDGEQRLVGIVTVDDAMVILQEESTEDISKMSAVVPSDKPYLKTSVWRLALNRLPWLLILMVSATFSGLILTINENVLSMPVFGIILTSCTPMLMGTGGNAGSQASAMVIRGLALGEVSFSDTFKVLWKEARVSIILGVVIAVVCFIKMWFVDGLISVENGLILDIVICLSMLLTVVFSKLVGALLPLLAKKCHLDPAVVASPLITTIVDVLSLTIFCAIAGAVLMPLV